MSLLQQCYALTCYIVITCTFIHQCADEEVQSPVLKQLMVEIFPGGLCKSKDWYGKAFYPKLMRCAGSRVGRQGSCVGDSGGPLSCLSFRDGRWRLAGVTSFSGKICGAPKKPAVYVRVPRLLNWIRRFIKRVYIHIYIQ